MVKFLLAIFFLIFEAPLYRVHLARQNFVTYPELKTMFKGKYPPEVWQLFSDIKNNPEFRKNAARETVILALRDIARHNGRGKEFEETARALNLPVDDH
jgi:hypothetical protein